MPNLEIDKIHLRHCMLYCFDLGKNASAATRMINDVYGDVVQPKKCQNWFRKFRSGNRDVNDAPRSGRSSHFNEDLLESLVKSDPSQSIRELSEKLGSPWSTVQSHLKLYSEIKKNMAQGKMKVKSKLPTNVKKTKKVKGSAITKRSNAPVQTKKKNTEEGQKIKKIVTKNVNKKMEEEIRAVAFDKKTTFSKAQKAVIAHNSKSTT